MADINTRRLPVGIQSFKVIREENYLYVDKSDIVWNLVNLGQKYNYLSRPRRFGKSVLVDTLEAYLQGRKDLFEGLKIIEMEKEWKQYPVVRLDMSLAGSTAKAIQSYLSDAFSEYESTYGITPLPTASLAVRFKNIVTTAFKKTGYKVAILIDEYDSPLQHSWMTAEHNDCTDVYRNVFAVLKACDEFEKFVFITGITKFTQISLFSVLNNLSNISFTPENAAICGITEEEMKENFMPEIKKMSEANNWSVEETHDRLKAYYDGYHFCRHNMVDVYNPYSLVNALNSKEIINFWASSGATSLLPKFVDNAELRMKNFENCRIMRNTLEMSDVSGGGDELFLYQSGYLTIKNVIEDSYVLGFPNREVKKALFELVLPIMLKKDKDETENAIQELKMNFSTGNVKDGILCLKQLIAHTPYSTQKKERFVFEEHFRFILKNLFYICGFNVKEEEQVANGRIDLVVETSNIIYVIELKMSDNGGMSAATQQIITRHYKDAYCASHKSVVGLALVFDKDNRGLKDWKEV